MGKDKYIDVNKEDYMKALFTELYGQTKMVTFPEITMSIQNFVTNNPTKDNGGKLSLVNIKAPATIDVNGMEKDAEGRFIIHKRKWITEKKNSKKKK